MPRLLALLDSEDTESIVVCGCAPFAQRQVQPAGRAFQAKFEKKSGSNDDSKKAARRQDGGSSDDEPESAKSPTKKKKGNKNREEALKLADCLKGEDLYGLLEVDEAASQDDLKKAYRQACLTKHPDKLGAGKSGDELEAVNANFVKLQEAYNVLSDNSKRRKYDSMGEFDDRVPTKLKDGQDFYEVFDEVFKRNAKWSENKPVPELGDANTPYEKVRRFYEFWFSFESWRNLDEMIREEEGEDCFQDLEDAESRDERRWMEKENASVRKSYLRDERQRIFGFVELAEKLDPRVKEERDKQFAAREEAKAAKEAKRLELERLAQEAAEKRAAEEEQARIAAAEEKAKRDEEKQVKKTARAKLRKVVKDLDLGLAEAFLQDFLLALEPEETDKLTKQISSGKGAAKGEAVFAAMKAKGVEPVLVCKEDEKSTEEGSPSEEEVLSPEEQAKKEKEARERKKKAEKRAKEEEAKMKIVREEEAAKRAVDKEARDVKKRAEQAKKDQEQQKQNKKEAEKVKRDEEKKIRDAEKLAEKARAEKEKDAQRSKELSAKQKAEKEADQEERALELRTFEYERDRLFRCDAYDKLTAAAVVEAAQAASETPVIASGLAAAAEAYEDAEELLDAQLSCLGSFFALGLRPAPDALALSSGLRSRVKKLRTKIRNAAVAGDFALEAPEGTAADAEALEQLMAAALGEAPAPIGAVEEVAAPEEAAQTKGKKKAKAAKAAPEEEDLDALLQEFGVETTSKKSKSKSGKKK